MFTPPPQSAADVLLPDVEPLFPALSSPPVLVTHSPPAHSALPRVSRDQRVQSLPASDMQLQLLPDAGDSYRFSSHLSIDTRSSSQQTVLHASPSASPPLALSPPVTPAYGSDDGQSYQRHRTRRQRRQQCSPSPNTSHTASIEVTPASSTSSSAQPSPLLAGYQLALLSSLPTAESRTALSPSSSPLMCEFCDEDIAEWYCCQCALGMCERHREEGHSRLYPISGGHQLLELSGHKEGQKRRRRDKEEAERRDQVKRQQEDEIRHSKRKQLMRTDSAALSPFAALQSAPISAAEEALRAEIEQNLQHIAEQRDVEDALMAAAKRANGRTSANSGQGNDRVGTRNLRVLDTPSITHRFVPLITKQDVVDNWSRLMDDVAHLYPKPKPKRSGRRTRTPANGTSDMTASSQSAVLPPQHESNSVQLSHILPIASRLGGRSVSAVSPSQRRSALARISCTPSPPLSPVRWKLEDDERERRQKLQADIAAQHVQLAEDWRQLQQRTRIAAEELSGYHQRGDSRQHMRHYSLARSARHEVDDSYNSPYQSSASSSHSSSMRRSSSTTHLPHEQLQVMFTLLPPPPPADRERSQSSPPRQLDVHGRHIHPPLSTQRAQQQTGRESATRQSDNLSPSKWRPQQQREVEEEMEEDIEESLEEEEGEADTQTALVLRTVDEKEFLPAPPTLQKQHVVPSHKPELDLSADETNYDHEDEKEEQEDVTEDSEMRSINSPSDDDSRAQALDDEEDGEQYTEESDDDNEARQAGPSSSYADGQLIAEWRRANGQQWELRQHSEPLQSEQVQHPQYRSSATQTDEKRMTQADVQSQSGDEQEEDVDEFEEEEEEKEDEAGSAIRQATPLRAHKGDVHTGERTPYAHMHRTPLAPMTAGGHVVDDSSDSDNEQRPMEEAEEQEEVLREQGVEEEEDEDEEEEEEDVDEAARVGLPSRRDQSDSESVAEPFSAASPSPQRSPASSFGWHDQDLNDAMWMKSSSDSHKQQPRHYTEQRRTAEALQLLPAALQAVAEPPTGSRSQHQHQHHAGALALSRLDEDVVLLAQTLQRILRKRDVRPPAYPSLPSFSHFSGHNRPHHSVSTSASASVRSVRPRRHASDMSGLSSFSRVSLPPHSYPRASPPVYPVSSQRLPPLSAYIGQQRADQQPAASTSSSSQSSNSPKWHERPHSGNQHSRRGHTVQSEQTARPPVQSAPTCTPTSPLRVSLHAPANSPLASSLASSLSLDLSHGALRRLDRLLASNITDKLQPHAHTPTDGRPHTTSHSRGHGVSIVNGGGGLAQAGGDGRSGPRIVQSSASAITVQLKAAQSLSILASMEHNNSGQPEGHLSRHRQHTSLDHAAQQHRRKLRGEKREPVSLAARAYQSMRAGEQQHGSRRAWNE